MPTIEQILNGLKEIANSWQVFAVFSHAYFAAVSCGGGFDLTGLFPCHSFYP